MAATQAPLRKNAPLSDPRNTLRLGNNQLHLPTTTNRFSPLPSIATPLRIAPRPASIHLMRRTDGLQTAPTFQFSLRPNSFFTTPCASHRRASIHLIRRTSRSQAAPTFQFSLRLNSFFPLPRRIAPPRFNPPDAPHGRLASRPYISILTPP